MMREGQFTVQMPDGMLIERLPVGYAAGEWWFTFVLTGLNPRRTASPRFHGELMQTISVTGRQGERLHFANGGSGGGDRVFRYDVSYRDDGLSSVTVTYRRDGRQYASEDLNLTNT